MTSSAVNVNRPQASLAQPRLISREGWVCIAVVGALFVLLFQHVLVRSLCLMASTMESPANSLWGAVKNLATLRFNPSWSHGLVLPLISVYYIYQNREKLMRLPVGVSWVGLPIFFAGLITLAVFMGPGRNDMLQAYSMIACLFGLVLFLLGRRMMSVLWFPILFLALGVKVSDGVWETLATKLQNLASYSAAAVLKALGVNASLRGTTIDIMRDSWVEPRPLNVAEACSGLRMLMAFISLGVAMAFLSERPAWQRWTMVLFTIPIAVAVNVGRVVVMGLLTLVRPEWTRGDTHLFIGMLMLIPAAMLFLLLGWVLDRIFIEKETGAATGAESSMSHPVVRVSAPFGPATKPMMSKGMAAGVAITAGLCLAYLAGLSSIRPDLVLGKVMPFFSGRVVQVVSFVLLALSLGGLCASGWWLGRLLRQPEASRGNDTAVAPMISPSADATGSGPRSRSVALGTAAGVLLSSVAVLYLSIWATGAVVFKKGLPLRSQLTELTYLSDVAGNKWQVNQVNTAQLELKQPMSKDELEALGSTEYTRLYFNDVTTPGREAYLHSVYYTGTVDTVPHVPDRCYVAGGAQALDKDEIEIELSGPRYFTQTVEGRTELWAHRPARKDAKGVSHEQADVRVPGVPNQDKVRFSATFFPYADKSGEHCAVYFFIANGRYCASPNDVRRNAFIITDRYSYYCKVEVRLSNIWNKAVAKERVSDLLSEVFPEILACLPDWTEVEAGRYPDKKNQE